MTHFSLILGISMWSDCKAWNNWISGCLPTSFTPVWLSHNQWFFPLAVSHKMCLRWVLKCSFTIKLWCLWKLHYFHSLAFTSWKKEICFTGKIERNVLMSKLYFANLYSPWFKKALGSVLNFFFKYFEATICYLIDILDLEVYVLQHILTPIA